MTNEANEKIVTDFCASWAALDIDRIMAYFSDDIIYHNMPAEPVQGTDAVREAINSFLPQTASSRWELKKVASPTTQCSWSESITS